MRRARSTAPKIAAKNQKYSRAEQKSTACLKAKQSLKGARHKARSPPALVPSVKAIAMPTLCRGATEDPGANGEESPLLHSSKTCFQHQAPSLFAQGYKASLVSVAAAFPVAASRPLPFPPARVGRLS